jgi:hypothetical protein
VNDFFGWKIRDLQGSRCRRPRFVVQKSLQTPQIAATKSFTALPEGVA